MVINSHNLYEIYISVQFEIRNNIFKNSYFIILTLIFYLSIVGKQYCISYISFSVQ